MIKNTVQGTEIIAANNSEVAGYLLNCNTFANEPPRQKLYLFNHRNSRCRSGLVVAQSPASEDGACQD
jgi:hypothetical protein